MRKPSDGQLALLAMLHFNNGETYIDTDCAGVHLTGWLANAPRRKARRGGQRRNVIMQQLKGFTSHVLRKEFPHLKKMPTLWTRSYYVESVGHISEETIRKYIEDQKNA